MIASPDHGLVLVADDEAGIRDLLVRALEGRRVEAVSTAAEVRERAADASLVLLDLRLGADDGMALLEELRGSHPGLPVVIMTAFASIESAVEAMRRGARDYLTKPFASLDALRLLVDRVLAERELERENESLRRLLVEQDRFEEMVGASPPMKAVYNLVDRLAPNDSSVLITGESGTGKELVARALHRRSPRRARPFLEINCAAIPGTLLESELFGYERGAFTGAHRQKRGLLETAAGGTVLLDEIGELPLELQSKLLRVLEDKRCTRLGATTSVSLDVRILAATNRDLAAAVRAKTFREDLYYRLAVLVIEVPPLRQREGDVLRLLAEFLPGVTFDPDALQALVDYPWPGNIRELKNFAERTRALGVERVSASDLPTSFRATAVPYGRPAQNVDLPSLVEAYERGLIEAALREAGGQRTEAARRLGISRQALQYKLEKYGI